MIVILIYCQLLYLKQNILCIKKLKNTIIPLYLSYLLDLAPTKQKVPQKKIDTILEMRKKKIAIKIDVERSEMDVLRGSKELLKGNDCLIQLECENENQKEVLEFLSKIGYAKLDLKGDNDDLYFANFKIE